MFHRCQRAVTGLQTQSHHCTDQERRLLTNVVSSLAQSLQDLSTNFRHTQSSYLKRREMHMHAHTFSSLFNMLYVYILRSQIIFVYKVHAYKMVNSCVCYYRYEKPWGKIQALFWLWSSCGGRWRYCTIWQSENVKCLIFKICITIWNHLCLYI